MSRKIKLSEEAISEILVADTDSESCAGASDIEGELEEEEEAAAAEEMDNSNRKLQQVADDYQPGNCLKEGTPIFIHSVGSAKGGEKREAPHINRDSSLLDLLMLSFYRKLSAAGRTDQPVLSTAHIQTSQT